MKSFLWAIHVISIPTIISPFFLYYTDGLSLFYSVVSVLFLLLSKRGFELPFVLSSAVFTALAVTVRQTNIILAVMNPAILLLQRYGLLYRSNKYPTFFSQLLHLFSMLFSELKTAIKIVAPFVVILLLFVLFFIMNGFSVVLGDKEHHSISLHVMQICYFSVFFCCVFCDEIVLRLYKRWKNADRKEIHRNSIRFLFYCLFVAL